MFCCDAQGTVVCGSMPTPGIPVALHHAVPRRAVQLSVEERRLLLLSALLLPLRKLRYKVKNKQAPATGFIIRESIKWRTRDVDGVELLHAQVQELAAVHKELAGAGGIDACFVCPCLLCHLQGVASTACTDKRATQSINHPGIQ